MLDAKDYLSRVVAPGNFYAFAFKRPEWTGLRHRFFRQSDIDAAVNWLKSREIGSAYDVWVGVAAYRVAEPTGDIDRLGQPRFMGKRTQANAEKLKIFWYDADIARPGDGKAADRVWRDDLELIRWLAKAKAQGLPVPNTWIRSGYGIHLYWVMDAALTADQWMPYAQAFKTLLNKVGARGDIGISADSARILRVPGTYNHKDPASPALCHDITPARVDPTPYPIKTFLNLLDTQVTTRRNLGPPPPGTPTPGQSRLNANAQAGIERPPPYAFASIVDQCPQVARSLAEGGEHDGRMLWHHMVNLAYACRDQEAAHRLGYKHPKYSQADTDAKWVQTEREHAGKDFGAPLCTSFDQERKGVCDTCPHWGKIKSPYSTGTPAQQPSHMPHGYRQTESTIERWDKDDGWITLINGAIDNVRLLRVNDTYRLTFDYVLAGQTHCVGVDDSEVHIASDRLRQSFVKQGVSLNRYNVAAFGVLMGAWINELRLNCLFTVAPPSFGWVTDKGNYVGLSVAGTFYRTDGTQAPAQPGDRKIHESYQPKGSIEKWREAAEFVTKDRPDLQVLVAAAFAAPLMEFVGESSVVSVWSTRSGARKTSAFRIGTSVWCDPVTGMSAIRDTPNSVQHSLGETRIMPVFWDEIYAASRDQVATMVEMIFNITQGRGRARLSAKIEQQNVGSWRTMMLLSTNRPVSELVERDRAHTNAGTLRVFEYQMEPQGRSVIDAPVKVAQCERNYGHAGIEFTKWVVQHVDEIKVFIEKMRQRLGDDLKTVNPNERFYVAAVLGIVAGAYYANKLKLLSFDVKAIYKFLLAKMLGQRNEREEDNPIDDESKNLTQTFERFVSDLTDETVISQSFSPQGRRAIGVPDRVKIIKRPGPICSRVMIHIGLDEGEMRFDHNRFKKWCEQNKLSAKATIGLMGRLWPITKKRAVLGIGTDWSSLAMVSYYRLPLNTPDLKHHLAGGTPNPDPSNVVPLPTRDK
jgi:hypothetical protein